MLSYRYPLIAREGWMWIAIAITAATMTLIKSQTASIPLWVLAFLMIFLFRNPYRKIPALPLGMVCPVDGRITKVEKVYDAYLERPATCISIKMGLFDIYSAHSPMEGKIIKQWVDVPRQIQSNATVKQDTTATKGESVTSAQWIQSDEGDDVVIVIEAKRYFAKSYCYGHSGERIGQGQRCGFLRFGTQVDILVPESTRIDVNVNDSVRSGTDIIATLVHTDKEVITNETAVNA